MDSASWHAARNSIGQWCCRTEVAMSKSKTVYWVASLAMVIGACSSEPGAEGPADPSGGTDEAESALPIGGGGANSCSGGGATCGEPDGTSAFHPGCNISCP